MSLRAIQTALGPSPGARPPNESVQPENPASVDSDNEPIYTLRDNLCYEEPLALT